jgi:hypothetical protein
MTVDRAAHREPDSDLNLCSVPSVMPDPERPIEWAETAVRRSFAPVSAAGVAGIPKSARGEQQRGMPDSTSHPARMGGYVALVIDFASCGCGLPLRIGRPDAVRPRRLRDWGVSSADEAARAQRRPIDAARHPASMGTAP